MNKKLGSFIIGICFFLAIANFISATSQEVNYSTASGYGDIQINSLKYEPYPANPGEYVDVWIKAKIGASVKYASFELIEEFPFSLDNDKEAIKEYSNFAGDIVMHYKVRIDKDAVEGTNDLKIEITSSKYSNTSSIYILEIEVADAQTDFDMVVQDSTTSEISLAIANIGKNTANSMIVRIPEQESYKSTGTNGQMVGNLESGDYTIVTFSLTSVGRNAGNPLIIQIDYTDSIGERRSVSKELDFNSGSFSPVNSTTQEQFTRGDFSGGNFPGMQQKKAKWPYFLAIGLLLIISGFFVYARYKKHKHELLKKEKINTSKSPKEQESPDWLKKIKDKEKK